MKKINLLCLFLFFSSTSLFSQSEYWQSVYSVQVGYNNRLNTSLFEKEFSFIGLSGRVLYEDTYFLEIDRNFPLPTEGSGLNANYFYVTEIENNDSSFYFAAQRTGTSGDGIYLNTFTQTPIDFLQTAFEIPDVFEENNSKGPAAIQVTNQEVIIFGNATFNKINIATDGTMSLDWSTPANYGLIADAQPYNGGYILCNEAGKLVYVDENAEEIWVKDLGNPLRAVLVLNDGFMIAAEIDEESALIKTNFDGTVSWEQKYGAGFATDLDFSNDDGIVFTGESDSAYVTKTNLDGEVIWSKKYVANGTTGSKIIRSQYGGYLANVRDFATTIVLRIDEAGNTGELVNGVSPARVLKANNLQSTASARGELFWDGDDVSTTFPKDSSTTTIFAGGLWISGLDQDGILHSAMTLYNQTDFSPGPFGTTAQDFQSWDKVWKITKKDIARLQEDLSDGMLDRPMMLDLWTYPGAGNPHFNLLREGEAVVPENMAPFVDVNSDGMYNILDGDYPDIKGDEMIWWIMRNEINGSNLMAVPFDLEIKGSLYAYDCDASSVLYNSDFLELDITNLSENEYSDLYIGTFVDYDLGCFLDDYMGTLPETNSIFAYNEDAMDDSDCLFGYSTFEPDKIPIQSITYLNNDLDYSMHYNNTSFNEPGTGYPTTAEELHAFLQTNWIDGTPQTEGGTGYGGTTPSDYAFPGNPANPEEWNMCSADIETYDRRMVMITGPKTLAPTQTFDFDIGLLTHENIEYACPDITQVALEVLELQNVYETGGVGDSDILGSDQQLMEDGSAVLNAEIDAVTYEWSTGDTTQTITVNAVGVYTVTAVTESGCQYVDEIEVSPFTRLSEVQINAPKVYPNPATDKIFIEIAEDAPQYITLENTLGQSLQKYEVTPGAEYSTIELNVGNLVQGMYLLRFHYAAKEKILLKKVVIAE